MQTVYVVSKYSRADRTYARHHQDENGLPLCGAKSSHTYAYDDELCDCKNCLRIRPNPPHLNDGEFDDMMNLKNYKMNMDPDLAVELPVGKYCRKCGSEEWFVSPDPDIRCCARPGCGETWQRDNNGRWIYDSDVEKAVEPEKPSSLADLIAQSLQQRESERIRAQKRWIYCYVGDRKHGDYAERPSAKNVVTIKQGDPFPEGNKHWGYSMRDLEHWFDGCTVKLGPNVWRWNINNFERVLLGQ